MYAETLITWPDSFLHAATSALPGALLVLIGAGQQASSTIGVVVRGLENRYPPTMSRAFGYRFLLAEALRRAGRREDARTVLAEALTEATDRNDYSRTFPGVLTAALLAADFGDRDAGQWLAGEWDRQRRRLGFPARLGYADPVAHELSHDPEAPTQPDPDYRWSEEDLRVVVQSTPEWCLGYGLASRLPAR